jgi:hypothetical protein
MFVPFPDNLKEPVMGRNIPDTRNLAVANAIENNFDYTMQIDADQCFAEDFFLKLWGGIKKYGENTIVTGWAKCKSGQFGGQPCVFRNGDDGEMYAVSEVELQTSDDYIEIDSFGTCGFLAPTSIFRKLKPPWFTDLNVIYPDQRIHGAYVGTKFEVGQDVFFTSRLREAGVKVVCATKARMPHEVVKVI